MQIPEPSGKPRVSIGDKIIRESITYREKVLATSKPEYVYSDDDKCIRPEKQSTNVVSEPNLRGGLENV